MEEIFADIYKQAQQEIDLSQTPEQLSQVNIKYLGRKGIISQLLKDLKDMPEDKRASRGKSINELKNLLGHELSQRNQEIKAGQRTHEGSIDVTIPGVKFAIGRIHPITKTINDICAVFSHMGFAIVEGPEIETERNNFEALNIPADHPSRDTFDTFYLTPLRNLYSESGDKISNGVNENWLLRSHTSPVQIRYMEDHKPPFSIIVPGKVFRPDAVDASHSFMFHQIEGLMVSDNISFANLKWVLFEFARYYLGPMSKVRFRPHFFPFTEPSAEVDVSCIICGGNGCSVCSYKGWLEILGAGMVHPNVFKAVGIDSQRYRGFAFGMGIERIAMLKYSIDDIRLFFENDTRFLEQF